MFRNIEIPIESILLDFDDPKLLERLFTRLLYYQDSGCKKILGCLEAACRHLCRETECSDADDVWLAWAKLIASIKDVEVSKQVQEAYEMKAINDILEKGKALVEEGWTTGILKRQYEGEKVHYCSWGALKDASAGYSCVYLSSAAWLFREAANIGSESSDHEYVIVTWNDDHSRTKADVLATFDKAIAKANEPSLANMLEAIGEKIGGCESGSIGV